MADINFDAALEQVSAADSTAVDGTAYDTALEQLNTTTSFTASDNVFEGALKQINGVTDPLANDPTFAGEVARAAVTGITDLANSFGELPDDLGLTDAPLFHLEPFTGRPETTVGKFGSVAVQFMVPFAGIAKGATLGAKGLSWGSRLLQGGEKAAKAVTLSRKAQVVKAAGVGAVTDFVAFSPSDPNLTAMLREHAELRDPITEFLATDANDPGAVNRLRNSIEGLGIGITADVVIRLLGKGIKAGGKAVKDTAKESDRINNAVQWGYKQFEEKGQKMMLASRKVEQKLFDQFLGVRMVEKAAMKLDADKFTPDKLSPGVYEEFRLLSSIGEVARTVFTDSTVRISKDGSKWVRTGKGLNPLMQEAADRAKNIDMDPAEYFQDFLDLMKYTRAKDIRKYYEATRKGKEYSGGIPREEVSTQLDRLQSSAHYKHMLKDMDNFKKFNKRMLNFMKESGVLDEESMANMLKVSDVWVPFYRQTTQDTVFKSTSNLRSLSRNPAKKRMVERTEAEVAKLDSVDDVMANMVRGYSSMIEYSMKNRAKVAFYNMVDEMEKLDPTSVLGIVKKADKKLARKAVSKEQLAQILKAKGADATDVLDELDDEFFNLYSKEIKFGKNTDMVYRNGKAEFFEIEDSYLQEAFAAMGPQQTGDFMKFIIKMGNPVKNTLTKMVTLNPGFFAGTNLIRDMVTASIQSRSGINPTDVFRTGMRKAFDEPEFQQYLLSGGGFGHAAYGESAAAAGEAWHKWIAKHGLDDPRHFKLGGTPAQVKKQINRMTNKVTDWVSKFEHASRMAEYKKLIDQGYSPRRAALMAREVSTDFGNKGSSAVLKNMSSITPFLNASMQGLYRYLRAVDLNKVQKAVRAMQKGQTHKDVGLTAEEWSDATKVWQRVAMYVGMPSASMYAFVHFTGEDRKKAFYDTPEHLRTMNWVLPMWKDEKGDWTYTVMPKPFEYGGLINVIEKSIDDIQDDSEKSILADYLLSSLQRITRTGDMSGLPHFARVPGELYMDKKFTGAPIVGNLAGEDPEKVRANTSATAIAASRAMEDNPIAGAVGKTALGALTLGGTVKSGTSPVVIEHVINSYLGSLGKFSMQVLDDTYMRDALGMGERAANWTDKTSNPTFMWTSKFIEKGPLVATSQSEDLYNRLNDATNVQRSLKALGSSFNDFDNERYEKLIADPENQAYLEMYPAFTKVLKELAGANKIIKVINNDDTMSGDKKMIELNNIYRQRNALLTDVNKIFESVWGKQQAKKEEGNK